MEKGDIAGEVPPKLLFIFEDFLAHPPEKEPKNLRTERKMDNHLARWSLDGRMVAHLWDVTWRTPYAFDVVTFRGKSFAEAIERRFEREHIPYGEVRWSKSPEELLALLPNTTYFAVVHGSEDLVGFFLTWDAYISSPEFFDVPSGGSR